MYYMDQKTPMLIFDDGSILGDISYLFKVRNFYRFQIPRRDELKKQKLFSI